MLIQFSYIFGESDSRFKIFDKYKLNAHTDDLMIEKYGEWDPNEGITVYEQNVWKRRSNMKGHHIRYSSLMYIQFVQSYILCTRSSVFKSIHREEYNKCFIWVRITSGIFPPYQTLVEDGCKSFNCFKGQQPDVMNALQSVLNFTYTIKQNNIPTEQIG